MRRLVVTNKSGFDVKDVKQPINIRDERGILFYTTEELVPNVKKFNLPKGIYYVDSGSFVKSNSEKQMMKLKLPRRERYFYPNPNNFKVLFADNPNKCTVDWNRKTITFDNSFKERPKPQIDFIMFHEFGHRFYKTEKFCDIYAVKKMLELGYNPSQIGFAQIDSLSDQQEERKNYVIDSFT